MTIFIDILKGHENTFSGDLVINSPISTNAFPYTVIIMALLSVFPGSPVIGCLPNDVIIPKMSHLTKLYARRKHFCYVCQLIS